MKDFSEFQKELYESGKINEFIQSHAPSDDEDLDFDLSSSDGIAHLMGISQASMILTFMDCLSAYHEWLSAQIEK